MRWASIIGSDSKQRLKSRIPDDDQDRRRLHSLSSLNQRVTRGLPRQQMGDGTGCPPDVLRNIQATTFVQPGQLPCHRQGSCSGNATKREIRGDSEGASRVPHSEDRCRGQGLCRRHPERLSDTEFATQEGTLYPLLSKMRRDGLVDYEWQESDVGPPRKYYELTGKGTAQLAELNDYWKHLNATIAQLGR